MAKKNKAVEVVVVPPVQEVVVAALEQAPKLTKSGLPKLPKLPRVRKPKAPKDCSCGCGQQTRGGRFIPGHDARLHGWALRVERKVIELKDIPDAGVRKAVAALLAAKPIAV